MVAMVTEPGKCTVGVEGETCWKAVPKALSWGSQTIYKNPRDDY